MIALPKPLSSSLLQAVAAASARPARLPTPFALQVDAGVAALDAILTSYRGFIAYAQHL